MLSSDKESVKVEGVTSWDKREVVYTSIEGEGEEGQEEEPIKLVAKTPSTDKVDKLGGSIRVEDPPTTQGLVKGMTKEGGKTNPLEAKG